MRLLILAEVLFVAVVSQACQGTISQISSNDGYDPPPVDPATLSPLEKALMGRYEVFNADGTTVKNHENPRPVVIFYDVTAICELDEVKVEGDTITWTSNLDLNTKSLTGTMRYASLRGFSLDMDVPLDFGVLTSTVKSGDLVNILRATYDETGLLLEMNFENAVTQEWSRTSVKIEFLKDGHLRVLEKTEEHNASDKENKLTTRDLLYKRI